MHFTEKNRGLLEKELFEGPDGDVLFDIDVAMRSRSTLLQISSNEENRVIQNLRKIAHIRGRKIIFWTCACGPFAYDDEDKREEVELKVNGQPWQPSGVLPTNPLSFLDFIEIDDEINPEREIIETTDDGKEKVVKMGGGNCYVLLDLPNFMRSASSDGGGMSSDEILLIRKLKDIRTSIQEKNDEISGKKTIIIVSRDVLIPDDLKKIIPVIDWPLPNKKAVKQHLTILSEEVEDAFRKIHRKVKFSKDDIEILSDSLLGLTLEEIDNVFKQSAVKTKNIEDIEDFVKHNIKAKKDIILKSRSGLEFFETDVNIQNNVGGLSELKKWLAKREHAYSEKAREYGLEYPKGLLIVGIPGNGKSLVAKAIANSWNKLLLRWDVGSVYSARVGSSEANIRTAIKTAEATAPCILWIDEIEKAFAGIGSSDRSDGGTAARVFATFLQWLSEKNSPVFVVATANRIDQLPAELIRKGRFDEVFYVDLPDIDERKEIIKIHLNKRKLDVKTFDIDAIADATEDFTGAELEDVIKESMYTAFMDNYRLIETDDIVSEAENKVPLSLTMRENVEALRDWANSRAKWASKRNSSKEKLKEHLRKQKLVNSSGIELIDSNINPDLGNGPQKDDD